MPLKAPVKESIVLSRRNLKCINRAGSAFASAPVMIAIAHRNQPLLLQRALRSALKQSLIERGEAQIVVLDDQSHTSWQECIGNILNHPAITVLSASCGSPARARNQLLDWAENNPHIRWVARLDADDELAGATSVEALYTKAEAEHSIAAIGSNQLRIDDEISDVINEAISNELLNTENLVQFIEAFCHHGQLRELPSCNLLLRADAGLRYPNIRSAEDHWLVMRLLFEFRGQVSLVSSPVYSIYSLAGNDTTANQAAGNWTDSRKKLAYAARRLQTSQSNGGELLGFGLEGVVSVDGNTVKKEFYPWALDGHHVSKLKYLLSKANLPVPAVKWSQSSDGVWNYNTSRLNYAPVGKQIDETIVLEFLRALYRSGVATLNIKRDNLRLTPEKHLHYIDIGKDIQPLTASYFLDMSARLYSIGILGCDDEELVRRPSTLRPERALAEVPGFAQFYHALISGLHREEKDAVQTLSQERIAENTTLLIKCCAQDSDGLYEQVVHIVTQLSYPTRFAQVVLLIDEHEGPFLRQYASPNLRAVKHQAIELKSSGIIHDFWTPPKSDDAMRTIYEQWFGESGVKQSHTINNAPLYPQVWAFSNLETRYVLQCDCDVLIGRKNHKHDYLAEMLDAASSPGVICVGFNIPKATESFRKYRGEPGEFAPEVRFGLLDLERLKCSMPFENPVQSGCYKHTWHRAIQRMQKQTSRGASVRGGSPMSFYIHPRNEDKATIKYSSIRDIIAQGIYPEDQAECFDVVADADWRYPKRHEPIVFLLKGRKTRLEKIQRCLQSLKKQTDQEFGIILIDDASGIAHSWCYPELLKKFTGRYTLIRNEVRQGHIANMRKAIGQVCSNSSSIIVILDQDDCLMGNDVVKNLRWARSQGHDLVQMPMFRPNKPLQLYKPDYDSSRQKGGGNTWAHMRAFTKELFESIPDEHLRDASDEWFQLATDYASMLPMAEMAKNPIFIDRGYAYWHERDDYSPWRKKEATAAIMQILAKSSLDN